MTFCHSSIVNSSIVALALVSVDGWSESCVIANNFARHFSGICRPNNAERSLNLKNFVLDMMIMQLNCSYSIFG